MIIPPARRGGKEKAHSVGAKYKTDGMQNRPHAADGLKKRLQRTARGRAVRLYSSFEVLCSSIAVPMISAASSAASSSISSDVASESAGAGFSSAF